MYWNITHVGGGTGGTGPLQLGSLALSMPFDQWFAEHRTLEHVGATACF